MYIIHTPLYNLWHAKLIVVSLCVLISVFSAWVCLCVCVCVCVHMCKPSVHVCFCIMWINLLRQVCAVQTYKQSKHTHTHTHTNDLKVDQMFRFTLAIIQKDYALYKIWQISLHNPHQFNLRSGYPTEICLQWNFIHCKCLFYLEAWVCYSDTGFPEPNMKFQYFYNFVIWHSVNIHWLISVGVSWYWCQVKCNQTPTANQQSVSAALNAYEQISCKSDRYIYLMCKGMQ